MKVAVIGGGSTYTPELVNGFLARVEQFPLKELWLTDIDPRRLEIVGGFAQRMVAHQGGPFKVVLTTDQREAIAGASYITTQLRVGQMEARRRDEYLGKRHGLIGQETTNCVRLSRASWWWVWLVMVMLASHSRFRRSARRLTMSSVSALRSTKASVEPRNFFERISAVRVFSPKLALPAPTTTILVGRVIVWSVSILGEFDFMRGEYFNFILLLLVRVAAVNRRNARLCFLGSMNS